MPIYPMWMKEYRGTYFPAPQGQAAEFGFPRLFNPLLADLPSHQWEALRDLQYRLQSRTLTSAHLIGVEQGTTKSSDVIDHGKIAITFDIYSPIRPQLEGLEAYLIDQQHYTAPKDIERNHRDKWLLYLRILDAREAKATWADCASILPITTAGKEQTARDIHNQAKQLQARL